MGAPSRIGFALLLCAASTHAQGRIYTCRDAAGHLLTSDRPIPECADRAIRELNSQGIVVREIAAPLTPEQRDKQAADERLRKEREDAEREQRRRDTALVAAYPDEAALEFARQRALNQAQADLKNGEVRLVALEKDRKANALETEFYQKKPIPPALRRRIDDTESAIANETRGNLERRAQIDHINRRFDEDKQRLKMLINQKATH